MKNRIAIVTGGSEGIGKATCRKLMQKEALVVAVGRNESKLKTLEVELAPLGKIETFQCDVTVSSEVERLVEAVVRKNKRIDILVNCVGGSMGVSNPVEDISEDIWNKLIIINLTSTYLCCKYVIPHMKKLNYGRIVNISSTGGRGRSFFGSVGYSAVKAGILGFTRQSSGDLGSYGVNMNVVAPGVVTTDRVKNMWKNKKTEEERQEYLKIIPLGRLGRPEEIAAAIAFLCSEEASYITGAVLDVNGGSFVG